MGNKIPGNKIPGNKIFYHKDVSEQYIKIYSNAGMCTFIKQNANDTTTCLKVSHFIIKDNKLNIYVFKKYTKKVKVETKKDLSGGRAKRYAILTTVTTVKENEIDEYKNPYLFASIPLIHGTLYSENQKECIQVEIEKETWDKTIRETLLASPNCHHSSIKITYNALKSVKRYEEYLFTLDLTTNKDVGHCEQSEYKPYYKKKATPVTAPIKF